MKCYAHRFGTPVNGKRSRMPTLFVVDGVEIDVTDRRAVQALTMAQYGNLLRQTLSMPHDPADAVVGLREEERSGPIWWVRHDELDALAAESLDEDSSGDPR